jgi:hypothetical protein
MCSVPMYSWLKRWASWRARAITFLARSVKRSNIGRAEVGDQALLHAEAHRREPIEALLRGEDACALERAESAPDPVEGPGPALAAEQGFPDLALPGDELGHRDAHVVDERGLAAAQRDLVAHLVEVAERPAALAVHPPHGEVDLLAGVGGLLHVLRPDEPGQVEHHREAQTGAHVGRAGGQEPEFLGEGDGQARDQAVVECLGCGIGLVDLEARAEDLAPQVILLVEHQRDALRLVVRGGTRSFGGGELTADEVALDEDLAVEFGQRRELDDAQRLGQSELPDLLDQVGAELLGLLAVEEAREAVAEQVACEADPRADREVAVRPGAPQPLPEREVGRDRRQLAQGSAPPGSSSGGRGSRPSGSRSPTSLRSLSRSRAASS